MKCNFSADRISKMLVNCSTRVHVWVTLLSWSTRADSSTIS